MDGARGLGIHSIGGGGSGVVGAFSGTGLTAGSSSGVVGVVGCCGSACCSGLGGAGSDSGQMMEKPLQELAAGAMSSKTQTSFVQLFSLTIKFSFCRRKFFCQVSM